MTDQWILDDDRFKDIAELVLDDEVVETDPAKSVITQPIPQEESVAPEWQIPKWFEPLQPYCEALLDEHPDFHKNVFVMMRFEKSNEQLDAVYRTTRDTLHLFGLNTLRASERFYANQLWDNERAYMLCCQYGIAIIDNTAGDELCPNVSLEYGFMSALNRPTMLLVDERTTRNVPQTDMTGAVFYTYNGYDATSVRKAVQDWVKRLGFSDTEKKRRRGYSSEISNFDIFLAHNSQDKSHVQAIANRLRERGLNPWLDVEQTPPGQWFQDVLQQSIQEVKSAAIFIGPSGLGKWQQVELKTFISQCVNREIPVIPVLLPGVDEIPKELLFLRQLNWVNFRESIEEPEVLDNLIWGITGKKPPDTF